MKTRNKNARLAGALYLILVISGIINLMYIPSKFIVWESAAETFQNIKTNELLFKLGIISGIITFLTFIFLPLALYNLLKVVHKGYAQLMVVLSLISIPISFTNILHKFEILNYTNPPEYLQHVSTMDLQTQVMISLENYNNGFQISQIFWGLWLFPFGYLVYKSKFLPRFLGVFLMVGCFGYVITFFAGFLNEDFYGSTLYTIIGIPDSVGEIGICLWLLIMGTNKISSKKQFNPTIE